MPKISPTYRIHFRRRREGKTNYRKRLKLLLSGKPRLVYRKTLKYIIGQIIEFDKKGDKTLVGITSKILQKYGWKFACDNTPASYLTGYLLGKMALFKGIKEAILDIGLYTSTKGGRMYAFAKGAIDAGLSVPCSEEMFPSEDRIKGLHISEEVAKNFEEVKKNIEVMFGGEGK
ncbi:MAG: 50S ribosomal protein L18 [Candidatus Aenigmarchaeota archaeon]|jgi:large subunit ribosomal protein L18|nr:50S ribosomal protein L18 [Candidatus Aenigmarchaeota archaeon]